MSEGGETPEPKLRGSLIRGPEPVTERPALRGSIIDKDSPEPTPPPHQPSQLKGSLISPHATKPETLPTKTTSTLDVGTTVTQRDSGQSLTIESIGSTGIALLRAPDGHTVTKLVADLEEALKTPGSAWHW